MICLAKYPLQGHFTGNFEPLLSPRESRTAAFLLMVLLASLPQPLWGPRVPTLHGSRRTPDLVRVHKPESLVALPGEALGTTSHHVCTRAVQVSGLMYIHIHTDCP